MPTFLYRGRDAGLALVTGTIDAETPMAAVQQLAARGVVATDVDAPSPEEPRKAAEASWWTKPRRRRISEEDLIIFSRQMYTLQKANVPILRALAGLEESTTNPGFAEVLADITSSLEQGRELSATMQRHPKVFSDFYVAMVRVGEISGRLPEVFDRLFQHQEFERDVSEQIRAALRYPMTVIVAAAVAMVVLNLFVIPVFAGVFAGMNAKLPLMTRVLIGFSDFMVRWWPLLAVAAVGGGFGIRAMLGTSGGRYAWDRWKARLPLVGDIILKATLARFCRSFAMASQSGIPVLQALTVVAKTADDAYVGRAIEGMRDGIERGESLYRCALSSGVFTPVVLQMIAVGEETGEIDSLLTEIAQMYEREVSYSIKRIAARMEPILLLLIACLVLVLALGIFLPMWSLGNAAMGRG